MNKSNVLLLSQVGIHDIDLVGEKNALLGEMIQHVTSKGINIPPGFVITVNAYNSFISYNALDTVIASILSGIDFTNPGSFQRGAKKIRSLISNASFPPELSQEIIDAYYEFSEAFGHDVTDVAVRSSAVAKGLNKASFTRQHETYLNVRGPVALLVIRCYSKLFCFSFYRQGHIVQE
jgi:pyruvate, water dikinase